jgi:dimethylargininase
MQRDERMPPARSVYRFNSAIVREPSRSVIDGLRAEERGSPTYEGVKVEHDVYIAVLRDAGVEVTVLPALESFPDSIFVEDPALVFTEGAIMLRPGAVSRSGEAAEMAPILRDMFETVLDLPAGFADGGDILVTPRGVMIGLSARTDRIGAEALAGCIEKLGHRAELVATPEGVLHFKTACSLLDEETVLSTARLVQSGVFKDYKQIIIPEGEEPAANALRVNDILMVPSEYPRSLELLDTHGYKIVPVATTQIEMIDAGLSCMSLRWYRDGK